MMKKFEGKNGVLFIILVIVYNLLPLYFFIFNQEEAFESVWMIILWILWYLLSLLFTPSLFRNKIELYDDYFIFYYGFFKRKYNIQDIKHMAKTKSLFAGTANSSERITILTNDYRDFYVSLKDNDGFIEEFKKIKALKKED